jgi:hypothetical protein
MSTLNPERTAEVTEVLVADVGMGEVVLTPDGHTREVTDQPSIYRPTGRVEFSVCDPYTREPKGTWSVAPGARVKVLR